MKVKKIAAGAANIITNVAISAASGLVGATAYTYCSEHDVLNDQSMSEVAGVVGFAASATATDVLLKSVKNGVIRCYYAHKLKNN